MYSLFIARYKRYFSFESFEDLCDELVGYLNPSDINDGVLEILTNFDPNRKNKDGFVVNNWQDFRTDCYIKED